MAELKKISVREVLKDKMIGTGLFDAHQADELTGRIATDENAMLVLLGRLAVEAERGGSSTEQGVRVLLNADIAARPLDTFNQLAVHELADESFPIIAPPD